MSDTLVSIVIPVYNSEKYISKTLESVLNQSYKNLEIIVIDDCSTDNSKAKILDFCHDERVQFLSLNKNLGKAAVLNTGIKQITGDYIAFIDSDDFWNVDKVRDQLSFMKTRDIVFSFTSYRKLSEKDNSSAIIEAQKNVTYSMMLKFSRIGYSTVMIKKSAFPDLSFPDLRKRQDYAFWLKLLKTSDAQGINKSYTDYLVRENSLSRNKIEMLYWNYLVYYKHEKKGFVMSLYLLVFDILSKISRIK